MTVHRFRGQRRQYLMKKLDRVHKKLIMGGVAQYLKSTSWLLGKLYEEKNSKTVKEES